MIQAVVIGASAGGVETLHRVLPQFPATIPYFICLVQHHKRNNYSYLCETLQRACTLTVEEAEDGTATENGHLYLAPADYHLLIESPHQLSLSLDAPEHYCRPAVDPLFTTAADCFGHRLLGAIFSGMGSDGALGLRAIHEAGGHCLVQSPQSTDYPSMPEAALAQVADAKQFEPDRFYHCVEVTTQLIP